MTQSFYQTGSNQMQRLLDFDPALAREGDESAGKELTTMNGVYLHNEEVTCSLSLSLLHKQRCRRQDPSVILQDLTQNRKLLLVFLYLAKDLVNWEKENRGNVRSPLKELISFNLVLQTMSLAEVRE